ncbi:MAG: DUF1631 family protein [Alcanivoracaceae bacterium]
MTRPADDRLARLFAGLYGEVRQDRPAATDEQLRAWLASVDPATRDPLDEIQSREAGYSLSARQIGVIRLGHELLRAYFSQPVFHPELGHGLLSASGRLLAEALPVDGWLLRPQHPVHGLMALIETVACGWDPSLPQAMDICNTVSDWLRRSEPVADTLATAQLWWAEAQSRQERIAARVAESEAGALRLRYVRQVAARMLNRQLAGRPLPDFVVQDVVEQWSAAFQWALLNGGERSPLWQKLVRGFGLLVWALQPEAADTAQRGKLTRVVEQLRAELLPLLDDLVADELVRQRLNEQIEVAMLCQLNSRPMDYASVPPVAGGSLLDDAGAGVSQDLLSEVAAIHVGDWFMVPESGRRMRLQLKLDEYQQLLFVNQAGVRLVSASFEEFAWQFSSAAISAVVAPVPLIDWSSERLNALAEQYRVRQEARQTEHKALIEAQAREAEAREHARRKALDEARRLSDARQQQEQEQVALKAAEEDLELTRRAAVAADHGVTEAQRRQRARLLVSGLTMGAWLIFHGETGVAIRRKLAVVLPSSGKYIFVDRVGTDKYDIGRDALIEAIASGAVEVASKDTRFDDALTRVVDGIRLERGFVDD